MENVDRDHVVALLHACLGDILWDEVVRLVQYGSRIRNMQTATSDWDFVVVVTTDAHVLAIRSCKWPPHVDLNIHTEAEYDARAAAMDMQVLESVFLAPAFVVFDRRQQLPIIHVNAKLLHGSVSAISTKAFHYAKLLWRDGNYALAIKNVAHAHRYVCYGQQLLEKGRIYDFECSNEFQRSVEASTMPCLTESFTQVMGGYRKELRLLTKQLSNQSGAND
jgi:hypothetical protein